MKKNLLLSSLLLASSTFNTKAQVLPIPSEGQFAVLKPKYSCEVNVPSGRSSSQVYFSQDCQTAFVLPSTNMKKTVLKPYFTADSGICDRLNQVKKSLYNIEDKISKLESSISKLEDKLSETEDETTIKVIKDKIDYLKLQKETYVKEQNNRLDPYYQTAAVRTQIRVESDVMDEVAAFQAANLSTVNSPGKVFPIRFVPAQITSGILAISSADPASYKGRSMLKVSFPGLAYTPNADEKEYFEKDAILLKMNGSMSGIVDLSAVSYCSVLNAMGEDVSTKEADLINAFNSAVALNYDYQVKVQTGVKLHMVSHLETRDFLSRIQDKVINSAFERTELLGAMVEGGVLDNLKIELDDKGERIDFSKVVFGQDNAEDDSGTKGLVAPLIGKFIKTHLDKMENKLEQLGVLKKIDEMRAKEIKAGETTEIGGYKTICSTTSRFFGLSRNTSCHNEPIYVQIKHDGISSILKQNLDNSTIDDEVLFETNQTTTVRHTSTFGKI